MKKTFLTIAAALLMCVPTFAQQQQKVDVEGLLKKIEKSDATIANEKKAAKASNWVKRAEIMMEAETAYTSNIYETMEANMVLMLLGNPATQEQAEVAGNPYLKMGYEGFSIYLGADQRVKGWEVPNPVYPGAIDKAIEAYNKAYDLNPKLAKKTAEGYQKVISAIQKDAGNYYFLRDFDKAAQCFEKAYEVSLMPAAGVSVDTLSIYNAGFTSYFSGDFERSVKDLLIAEELGFYQDGELYNVLYNSYRSMCGEDKEKLAGAKEFLLRGLKQFPGNSNIITCLTDLYLALGENPEEIVPLVKTAIESEPTNAMLWYGLGSVYKELKNYEEAMKAFEEVIKLDPTNSAAHYFIGYLYVLMGDAKNDEVNAMPWTGRESYNREYQKVLDLYAQSVAPFEKAYELNPNEIAFAEYLKVVTFKLRDMDPQYQEKYEKYNEIFKQMSGR